MQIYSSMGPMAYQPVRVMRTIRQPAVAFGKAPKKPYELEAGWEDFLRQLTWKQKWTRGVHQVKTKALHLFSKDKPQKTSQYFQKLAQEYETSGKLGDVVWAMIEADKNSHGSDISWLNRTMGQTFAKWGAIQRQLAETGPNEDEWESPLNLALMEMSQIGVDYTPLALSTFKAALVQENSDPIRANKPHLFEIHLGLSRLYESQDQLEKARDHARKLLVDFAGQYSEGYTQLANLYLKEGKSHAAVVILQVGVQKAVQSFDKNAPTAPGTPFTTVAYPHLDAIGHFAFNHRNHSPELVKIAQTCLTKLADDGKASSHNLLDLATLHYEHGDHSNFKRYNDQARLKAEQEDPPPHD